MMCWSDQRLGKRLAFTGVVSHALAEHSSTIEWINGHTRARTPVALCLRSDLLTNAGLRRVNGVETLQIIVPCGSDKRIWFLFFCGLDSDVNFEPYTPRRYSSLRVEREDGSVVLEHCSSLEQAAASIRTDAGFQGGIGHITVKRALEADGWFPPSNGRWEHFPKKRYRIID